MPGPGFIARLADVDVYDVCSTVMPRKALTRHRLTAQRYRALRDAQDGVCGICERGNLRGWDAVPLFVDHDHVCCPDHRSACGRCVRGLLCSGCNGWLGMLELWGRLPGGGDPREDRAWRRAALAYLVRASCDPRDSARLQLVRDRHRQKTAAWPQPCRCPICDPNRPRFEG